MERGLRAEVAVEEGLRPVADALRRRGYHVTGLHPEALRTAAAVVVSGQDESLMGIQTIRTEAPVSGPRTTTSGRSDVLRASPLPPAAPRAARGGPPGPR